jgi:serine/threonine protein kinase/HEAT repeat protein
MTAQAPHLASLSADERRQLESLLLKFDQSWDEKRLPAALRNLSADSPLRRPALIELIKLDLEHRRKAGQKVRIESYLKPLPELGTADDLPVDLILAEYQMRRQAGAAGDVGDYAKRFPRQADELRQRIQQADLEASAAALPDHRASTVPPGQAKGETVRQAGGTSGPTALPEQFGRYRILKCLGKGGMGSVYLAHDPQLDRQVALKEPHFSSGDGPQVLERFAREARAAATIDHPNICPVYDVGVHDGVHYVTMAYIEGRPLSELVRDGKPLPPRPAAAVVRKLALALAEAHRHGVIHRDLKPSNVMVNRRKEPVIMDFGLARRVNKDDERLTKAGAVLGTPAYMPPEQVSGDVQAMGPACDVYSLGVMLYEMLTGRPPFQGQLASVFAQILTREPEPPSKLRPGLDPDLEAICLKAMAKKPKDRFTSMDEMADALERYLKGEASSVKTRPAAASTAKGQAAGVTKKGDSLEGSEMAENLLAKLVDRLESHPARAPAPPPAPPQRGAPWWLAPVAALAIVAGVLAVVFVLINRTPTITVSPNFTNNNTVAVQLTGLADRLSDPTVIIILDGRTVSKAELSQPISLTTGDHELVMKRGDAVIETRKFAVGGQGDTQTVQVPPPKDGDKGPDRLVDPAPPGEPSTAVKALLDALTDPDSNDVRRQAAESIKKLGDKTAVGPLEDRIADDLFKDDAGAGSPSYSSKVVALEALKELAPEYVTPALIRATHSATEGVRVWACDELGTLKDKLKTKEGTDGLIAALKDDKAVAVRVHAARALASGRHTAVPGLAYALFDDSNDVRREAANTLRALSDRATNRPDAVMRVIDGAVSSLEKRVADDLFNDDGGSGSPSYSSKVAAVGALRQMAPEYVTRALLGALAQAQEKNEGVRIWACQELGKQNDQDSLEGLAAASKADKSPKVREQAVKALVQRNK